MKLIDYLSGIRNCPNEFLIYGQTQKQKIHKLTFDFGIYDNWPIFTSLEFNKLENTLDFFKNFEKNRRGDNDWTYKYGAVRLQTFGYIPDLFLAGSSADEKKQMKYVSALMLHPCPEKKAEIAYWQRAAARVIAEFSQEAISKNIPFCFPDSRGWKHLDDYSRIVYFPDSVDDEMARLRAEGKNE